VADSKGLGYGSIALGGLLVFAGIKGYSLAQATQDLIQGHSPLNEPVTKPISGSPASGNSGLTSVGVASAGAAGNAISTAALKYRGAGYVWGGSPANGVGNWDCSSFANWVCGHDVGLPIPGYPAGGYAGASHGPVTVEWLAWSGLVTVGHDGRSAQAGDLAIWQTHMGICLGPDSMISAQTPSSGTQISTINNFIPEILFIRRYKANAGTAGPH
jgi:cell wall-associated NlpC family hydrolase